MMATDCLESQYLPHPCLYEGTAIGCGREHSFMRTFLTLEQILLVCCVIFLFFFIFIFLSL